VTSTVDRRRGCSHASCKASVCLLEARASAYSRRRPARRRRQCGHPPPRRRGPQGPRPRRRRRRVRQAGGGQPAAAAAAAAAAAGPPLRRRRPARGARASARRTRRPARAARRPRARTRRAGTCPAAPPAAAPRRCAARASARPQRAVGTPGLAVGGSTDTGVPRACGEARRHKKRPCLSSPSWQKQAFNPTRLGAPKGALSQSLYFHSLLSSADGAPRLHGLGLAQPLREQRRRQRQRLEGSRHAAQQRRQRRRRALLLRPRHRVRAAQREVPARRAASVKVGACVPNACHKQSWRAIDSSASTLTRALAQAPRRGARPPGSASMSLACWWPQRPAGAADLRLTQTAKATRAPAWSAARHPRSARPARRPAAARRGPGAHARPRTPRRPPAGGPAPPHARPRTPRRRRRRPRRPPGGPWVRTQGERDSGRACRAELSLSHTPQTHVEPLQAEAMRALHASQALSKPHHVCIQASCEASAWPRCWQVTLTLTLTQIGAARAGGHSSCRNVSPAHCSSRCENPNPNLHQVGARRAPAGTARARTSRPRAAAAGARRRRPRPRAPPPARPACPPPGAPAGSASARSCTAEEPGVTGASGASPGARRYDPSVLLAVTGDKLGTGRQLMPSCG
jgi:hypothetical protein